MNTFLEAKQKYDKDFSSKDELTAFLPVNLDIRKNIRVIIIIRIIIKSVKAGQKLKVSLSSSIFFIRKRF